MAVKKTIQIGNPLLKKENKIIANIDDTKVKQVIQDCIDTMRENNLIGIAAPQIGENYKIFVTEPRETPTRPKDQTDNLRVYINPEIVELSEEMHRPPRRLLEACSWHCEQSRGASALLFRGRSWRLARFC